MVQKTFQSKADVINNVVRALKPVIWERRDGQAQNFDDSLNHWVKQMNFDLRGIKEDNEFNGVPIQPDKKPQSYQSSLNPVLNAAAAVMNAVAANSGFARDICLFDDQRLTLGNTVSVDLLAAEEKLVGGINQWLEAVRADPDAFKATGLPLAINDAARKGEPITRLSDVLELTDKGYVPKKFFTNDQAQSILKRAYGEPQPAGAK